MGLRLVYAEYWFIYLFKVQFMKARHEISEITDILDMKKIAST